MTRDQVQIAINEGIPFAIRMAYGKPYEVTDRYGIALSRTSVVVIDSKDVAHVLPLLTTTGISYLKPKK